MEKQSVQPLFCGLVIALGLVLMAYKIVADSEPGLIPLALVAAGITWYAVTRARNRMHRPNRL